MSPEQAGLSSSGVDTRTDIYSLGVVLYELLAGALPFDARTLRRKAAFEMLRVIREEEPPRLTSRITSQGDVAIGEIAARRLTEPGTLLRRLRGDLEWITARALEKEPARRYGSVSELGADIRHHLASEPVAAAPPDLRYRLVKLARKHKRTAIAATVAGLALIVAAVVSTFMWITAERARRDNREHLKMLNVSTGLQLAAAGDDLKALPWLVRALQLEEGGRQAEELHRIRIRHVLDGRPYPVRVWYHEGVVGATLSSNRAWLATWDQRGTVRVWNASNGDVVGPFLTHDAGVVELQIAGTTVVSADEKGTIRGWDMRTGAPAAIASMPAVHLLRVSADAALVLGADRAGNVRVWDRASGRPLMAIRLDGAATAAEFLDGGRIVAVSDIAGPLQLVEVASGRTLARLPHRAAVVNAIPLDADRLATIAITGALQLWNLHTAAPLSEPSGMLPSGIGAAKLSANRTTAFLCGAEGAARISVGASGPPARLGGSTNCGAVDTSDDGLFAAAGYADGTARVWFTSAGPLGTSLPHPAAVISLGFLPESRYLLCVTADGLIRVWDLSPAAVAPRVLRNFTYDVAFSPDGRRLALASGSTEAIRFGHGAIIDAATYETMLPPLRHGGNVRGIAFSHDGRLVATTSDNGTARLWDAATGEPVVPELRHFSGGLRTVLFGPDDTRLVTFGLREPNASATLWSVPDGQRIASLPSPGTYRGSFSPDGQRLVTVSGSGPRVEVWTARDGAPVAHAKWTPYGAAAFVSNSQVVIATSDRIERRALDETSPRTSAAIPQVVDVHQALDGSRLVLPTASGAIHVLNGDGSLEPRYQPMRLPGLVEAAEVSADGRWVAGASWQRRAQVWSLGSGEPVTAVRELPQLAMAVSFAPDGSRVAFSGRDALTWQLRPDPRSTDSLQRASQLLSGHTIEGGQLVALPVHRVLELARDRDVIQSAAADDSAWRRMLAGLHTLQRDWAAAASLLATLAAEPDAVWETHTASGHALAELGRWREAEAAFNAALARRPDWTELHYYAALARFAAGDRQAIATGCTEALRTVGATRNPDRAHWLASICVLTDMADTARQTQVVALARIAADIEPDSERFVMVHAAALIRASQPDRAEAILSELLRRNGRTFDLREEKVLALALAQKALGRSGAAAGTRAQFEATPATPSLPWHRRLEIDLWRRELLSR